MLACGIVACAYGSSRKTQTFSRPAQAPVIPSLSIVAEECAVCVEKKAFAEPSGTWHRLPELSRSMADYIYLLETRLSKAHHTALSTIRSLARAHELTVFLVGGTVRDLISGAPVRDLDVVVQGNARKLRKDIEKAGGEVSAEVAEMQILHVRFPQGVRMEVGSAVTTTYPKPGRVVASAATILDDLRRRDFTANAMAL